MSLGIRAMREGEEDAVAVLIRRLPKDIGLDVVPKITGASLRECKDVARVTVADNAGLIVGVCLWTLTYSSWRASKGCYISDLYVLSHMRGRKVGEKLLRGVTREAQKMGANFIKLEVDEANDAAEKFYDRFGFVHKKQDRFFVLEPDAFKTFLEE
jgi:ribosomal protein S18 acetylase RimI-like enzyme